MSFVAHSASSGSSGSEEDKRALRLASARKKLQTFRASRTSDNSDTSPMGSSSASSSKPPSPTKAMPLTTEASINSPFTFPSSHSRSSSTGKAKDFDFETPLKPSNSGHRHKRSDSQAHRRQRSSISVSTNMLSGQGLSRPSIMGVFDAPKEILAISATPSLDPPSLQLQPSILPDKNHEEVAARLTSFSFGSKPPMSTFPPKRRHQQPLLPSQSLFNEDLPSASPLASPTSSASVPNLNRLSTPLSRPPSFLVTQATPLAFESPTTAASAKTNLASLPSSPPTPARKRHSHTRSNSISLPNLKLSGARPNSLGIPPSNSIPSSPCSPTSIGDIASRSRLSSPITGQRLKFEPSGRGAEAEKEREVSRRQALEKLTGGPSQIRSPEVEPQVAEISLPDLDDEDSSSVASSNRPLSGAFGSGSGSGFFSRPSSLTLPPLTASAISTSSGFSSSPFSWGSPSEQQSPVEKWSGFGFGLAKDFGKDDVPNFGMDLPTAVAKRPSINRQLSALAEVDESEEDDADLADTDTPTDMTRTCSSELEGILSPVTVEPTPHRLRELRLGSSMNFSTSTPPQGSLDSVQSFSSPRQSNASPSSPTKGYGSIGRGRPKPLNIGSTCSTPITSSTPKSAGFSSRRRPAPGLGSRGSSISYKKDDSSSSSHDLSLTMGKNVLSPESVSSPLPTRSGSPKSSAFHGWGNASKSSIRPCPRPKTLVGLGIDNSGSGRILGGLDEVDEEGSPLPAHSMWTSPIPEPNESEDEFHFKGRRDSFAEESAWRDVQLEMEMEREALKEDVDTWKMRCSNLEEKLEIERKESTILRERVRKLGDRLSSVSSMPTERSPESHTAESRLIVEMRAQLFNLTTSLEAERKAKEHALSQLAEISRPHMQSYEVDVNDEPLTATPTFGFPQQIPETASTNFTPIVTPASLTQAVSPRIEAEDLFTPASQDPTLTRMKGWGFPKDPSPSKSAQSQSKKRESFFGLSTVLKRSVSAEHAEECNGMDLPCFVVPTNDIEHTSTYDLTPRSFSEPVKQHLSKELDNERDIHSNSGFNSAVSFLSSYLPTSSIDDQSRKSEKKHKVYIPKFVNKENQQRKVSLDISRGLCMGKLDFSEGCKCCSGPVIEL
ncbi:uncharacterized protein I206_104775 [Kwoniella pini CBS 10737]|uniref:Uncharacterized protein n=1 Tax=Kwoniella pini CBS 10737 TaxID=1296096 RepID=A0A1B9I7Y1_9TREE|nr:uncharacterized protein I206_02314 [Kwoniella pini CBS 10737]OCF51599.1 hypothetical protein I206_02314 [Kwoniella pini CBS 10737]